MAERLITSQRLWRWLAPGLEVKRWLLLFAFSVLLLDLGAAYVLKEFYGVARLPGQFYWITLQFWPHWLRAVIFGSIGLGRLVFSFIKLRRARRDQAAGQGAERRKAA